MRFGKGRLTNQRCTSEQRDNFGRQPLSVQGCRNPLRRTDGSWCQWRMARDWNKRYIVSKEGREGAGIHQKSHVCCDLIDERLITALDAIAQPLRLS